MTINEVQDKIINEMSKLNDWLDKYEYLIEIGKKHISLDDRFKIKENAIQGCQSNVWIHAELKENKLIFQADSDSMITKGILILLLRVLNNQSPTDIATADLYFIDDVGLSSHLSPSRANGLLSIVKQLKLYGTNSPAICAAAIYQKESSVSNLD